jgi:hypothetical protein
MLSSYSAIFFRLLAMKRVDACSLLKTLNLTPPEIKRAFGEMWTYW